MADLNNLVQELEYVLASALGGNHVEIKAAEQKLKDAEATNFTFYLRALAAKFGDESGDDSIRNLSGICLKNAIKGNVGSAIDRSKRERYATLDTQIRCELRENTLKTLLNANSPAVSKMAAQVTAALARIELSGSCWPELLPTLTSMYDTKPEESLIAMSYLMEDVFLLQEEEMISESSRILQQSDVNLLLEPLVKGCDGPTESIRIYALQGFYHALNLCEENMKVEEQQQAIMRAITSNLATSQPPEVQHAAWDACVQLAMEYYNLLEKYITDMFPMSLSAMNNEDENLAISAVEFWSTICDYELYLKDEGQPENDLHIVDQAKSYLIPVLLKKIMKEDEDDDEQWTLSMAVSTCLSLCAQVLGDKILDVPKSDGTGCWVEEVILNFENPVWSHREAALMAFGSILEGPSSDKVSHLIDQGLNLLINGLEDPTIPVRETAAWTVGRIAQFHPEILLPLLPRGLIDLLLKHLTDDAKVAKYVCYAFYELSDYCTIQNHNENLSPYQMVEPYFQSLCAALLSTAQSNQARDNSDLQSVAYEALSKLICATPSTMSTKPEFVDIIWQVMGELLRLLEQSVTVEITDDVQRIQGHLAGCLAMACSRTECISDDALLDRALRILLSITIQYRTQQNVVLNNGQPIDDVNVAEDSLESIDCLNVILYNHTSSSHSPMFQNEHLETIQRIILDGLVPEQNSKYIESIVHLCRSFSTFLMARVPHQAAMEAIGPQIKQLFHLLQSPLTDFEAKPVVIQVLGDLAMTCGNPWFVEYIGDSLNYMEQAALSVSHVDDDAPNEWRQYVESVRGSVLGAYSGILYGVQSPMDASVTELKIETDMNERSTSVPFILKFLHGIFLDSKTSEDNIYVALGLTGDLMLAFKQNLVQYMLNSNDAALNILPVIEQRVLSTTNERNREVFVWIQGLFHKFKA